MAKNRQIKYMGGADIRRLEKGEDFGGQLSEPLDTDIEWNWDNRHVVSTGDFDVPDEAWDLLLEQPDFKDVTGMKRIPTNEAQQRWRGMPKSEDSETALAGVEDDEDSTEPETGGSSGPTTTTTGGSTRGGGGSRRGGGTTTGGST